MLAWSCHLAPAFGGSLDAEEGYRGHFEFERPDPRSLWQRALQAIGFENIEVGRSYALLAGVDWYPRMSLGAGEALPPARADLEMLKKYLVEQEHVDELIVLRNEDFTIANLSYLLHSYLPEQFGKHGKSRLLFAFSGHGVNEAGIGHLLTQEARSTSDVAGGISLTVLRGLFARAVSAAHHLLVLVNACEPGGFIQTRFGDESLLPQHPGAHAIMAGGNDESTWSDSRPGRQGSLFFEAVIDGLNGGADTFPGSDGSGTPPGDGIVTTDELQTYLKLTIRSMTSQVQNPDGGNIRPGGSNGSFFFLNRHRQVAKGVARPWDHRDAYTFGATPLAYTQTAQSTKPSERQVAVGVFAKRPGEVFRDCPDCPEMVVIPAGRFTMGSPDSEPGRYGWEGPQHEVEMRFFALGKHEVTFAEYDACVADGGCAVSPDDAGWGRGRLPVINVSWDAARAYVRWLSGRTGKLYRLPSEAAWKYAARAGTQTPFSFGRTITPDQANYWGNHSYDGGPTGRYLEKTASVGSYPRNAFGLHDMHGNVWEWVEDCWHDSYVGAPDNGDAWTTGGDCSVRVLRGGSWLNIPSNLRSAFRLRYKAGTRYYGSGFRVARTLDR